MARQLWLLRHADAEPHGARPDSERRLTARGEEQARLAGLALTRWEIGFDAVLVSPKVRAWQTAELAAEAWSGEQRGLLQAHPPLAGGFDAAQALDALAGISPDGRLMVVGHEPDLSQTIGELTGARVDLKKGGLAVVRLEGGAVGRRPAGLSGDSPRRGVSPGFGRAPLTSQSDSGAAGELTLLLRPRELALIAGASAAAGV